MVHLVFDMMWKTFAIAYLLFSCLLAGLFGGLEVLSSQSVGLQLEVKKRFH